MEKLATLDLFISQFFISNRNDFLTTVFIGITNLGSFTVVVAVATIICLLFFVHKKRIFILPFIFTLLGTGLNIYLLKILVRRERPGEDFAYYLEKTFSFPSGHTAFSVALYGFLIYFFLRNAKTQNHKTLIIISGIVAAIAIGLSRLYLGVHYFSDVVGGFAIGLSWLAAGIIFIEINFSKNWPKFKK